MRQSLLMSAAVLTLIVFTLPAEGKRITLVPISASEVYRILREAGREDAIPEGRVISQGIAAISGFTVGLTKGVGGSILFDIAANLLRAQNVTTQAQEICFNSRSLNDINDDGDYDEAANDDDDDADYAALGRQVVTTPVSTTGSGSLISSPSGTNTNLGSGTNTVSASTTQSGLGGAVNCVVIQQQPAATAAAVAAPAAGAAATLPIFG